MTFAPVTGTPNVAWGDRWVALIRLEDEDRTPDAVLHYRQHVDEYGLTSARCGARGRAVDLKGTFDRGHPVVGCPRCLQYLPERSRRRYAL